MDEDEFDETTIDNEIDEGNEESLFGSGSGFHEVDAEPESF